MLSERRSENPVLPMDLLRQLRSEAHRIAYLTAEEPEIKRERSR